MGEAPTPTSLDATPGPLAGTRVVELGDELGEYCGLLLAGLGAEVVKVEPREGAASRRLGPFLDDVVDPEHSLFFWTYNRGKRSIALAIPEERPLLEQLVDTADVLLDSTPNGTLAELDLDDATLRTRWPTLIHARLSPFGATGPWAGFQGSDLVHLALGGVMMNCGYDPDPTGHYDLPPIAPQLWHSLHIAGEQLAIGVVAALLSRAGTGAGQQVSCAIHEAVAKSTENDLMSWVMLRQPLLRQTCRHSRPAISDWTVYYTKDGRWVNAVGLAARDRRKLRPFLDRYGMAEGFEDPEENRRQGAQDIPGNAWKVTSDGTFVQRLVRRFRYDDLPWREAQEAGLLWAPVRKPHENAIDDHWLARGTFSDVEHPELGRSLRYPTSKWLSTRGSWTPGRRAPRLDEDRAEVLAAVTPRAPITARPRVAEPRHSPYGTPFPLQGVRILDFTWFLASSGATRFLAALGAEVIKVEWKTHPDSGRGSLVPEGGRAARRTATVPLASLQDPSIGGQFNNKNTGKRALSLNVADPKGLEIAKALLVHCDVVSEGFSPGVLERWGLGYPVQQALKPDIIYVKQSGMGTFGTYGTFRAVGPIAAALSGVSEMSGLPEPAPPAGWGYSYLDWFGAYSMALAILSALHHREQTGEGQWIDASQTEAGIFLTGVPVLDWTANGRVWGRTGNRSAYQSAAPEGVYRTRGEDRWIAVTCSTDVEWEALARAAGHPEWLDDPRFASRPARLAHLDALDALVESWTGDQDGYHVMHTLQGVGVPAGVCQSAEDRCERDPQLEALGWLTEVTATKIGTWPVAELPIRMSDTPPHCGGINDRGAPLYGEDTRAVLAELLGLSDREVEQLAADGVV